MNQEGAAAGWIVIFAVFGLLLIGACLFGLAIAAAGGA